MNRRAALSAAALAFVIALIAGGILAWQTDAVRWRAHVLWLTLGGRNPDLSVMDAARIEPGGRPAG